MVGRLDYKDMKHFELGIDGQKVVAVVAVSTFGRSVLLGGGAPCIHRRESQFPARYHPHECLTRETVSHKRNIQC